MADPRIEQYARLLVERCVDVQPGWEVVVVGSTLARPLIEEIMRAIGRRKAVPVVQLSFSGMDFWPFETVWAEHRAAGARRRALAAPRQDRGRVRRLDPRRRAREHPRRRRPAAGAARGDHEGRAPADRTPARARHPVGHVPLPHARARAGRRNEPARLRGLPLRRGAPRLGRRGREDEADQGTVRPRRGGADRRPRAPTCGSASPAARARSTTGT